MKIVRCEVRNTKGETSHIFEWDMSHFQFEENAWRAIGRNIERYVRSGWHEVNITKVETGG